jgi:type I restriction enzyme M protein
MPKIRPFYLIEPDNWLCKGNQSVLSEYKRAVASPQSNEYQIEEYVRQWVLRELLEIYGYPESWMTDDGVSGRVYLEWSVAIGTTTVYADIALLNEWRRPFLFIETKNRSIDIHTRPAANKPSAVEQVQSYASAVLEANVCIATNGDGFYAGRIQVDPTQFVNYPDIPSYSRNQNSFEKLALSKEEDIEESENSEFEGTGGEGLQIAQNFDSVLHGIHDILRGDENLQPDEALDEMCKLMFVKFHDELNTRKGEKYKFQEYIYGNAEELGSVIRTLYSMAQEEEAKKLKQKGKYDSSKTAFSEKIIIKDSTIKRIVGQLQDYSLKKTSIDAKGRAFERFLGNTFRGSLGQYFTPEPVVKLLVGILDPQERDYCIDPACGSARILTQILDYVRANYITGKYGDEKLEWEKIKNFAEDQLHGIEVSRRLVRVAVMDMMIYDDGRSNIRCTDGLAAWEDYPDLESNIFSVAATNPPFGASITDDLVLSRFILGRGQGSVPKEILFLERCLQLLKPGGRLGIVMPDGILSHTKNRDLFIKEFYRDKARLAAVVALPFHTFVPFGANARTSILFMQKWHEDDDLTEDYEIKMVEVEDIGYNPAGQKYGEGEIDIVIEEIKSHNIWR